MEQQSTLASGIRCQIWSPLVEHGSAAVKIEDLSRTGAMVRWPEGSSHKSPKTGDRCRLELELPGDSEHGRRTMACEGEVVKICGDPNPENGYWRVAVKFLKLRITSEAERPVQYAFGAKTVA